MPRIVLTLDDLSKIKKLRLHYPCVTVADVASVAVANVAKELRMKDLLREHLQIIIIGMISFLILYHPQLWYAYIMDFIICCWSLNLIANFLKKILNKGVKNDTPS